MARYAYFWGCYVPSRLPHVEKATRAVMHRLGIDCADVPDLTCCPEKTMVGNMSHDTWLITAARNLSVAEQAHVDFVTPCPGCFGTLRGAACELKSSGAAHREVNRRLAAVGRRYRGTARVRHIMQVLYEQVGITGIQQRLERPLTGMRIAVHYGCHLLRPSEDLAFDDPASPTKFDELVEALGATSIPYEAKLSCCGGLLSRVDDEQTGRAMAWLKLRDVAAEGADAICVACPACMMQYEATQLLLERKGEELHVPVLYYTELLGLAVGLTRDELGLSSHRVSVEPFLDKWEAQQAAVEAVREHFEYDLLTTCAECGACNSDCPVRGADLCWDPNAIIRKLAEGRLEQVLEEGEFWRCLECYGCRELCFQRYSMIDIFRTAKRLAVAQGRMPSGTAKGMAAFGKSARLADASVAQRKRLGLPEPSQSGSEELAELLAPTAAHAGSSQRE